MEDRNKSLIKFFLYCLEPQERLWVMGFDDLQGKPLFWNTLVEAMFWIVLQHKGITGKYSVFTGVKNCFLHIFDIFSSFIVYWNQNRLETLQTEAFRILLEMGSQNKNDHQHLLQFVKKKKSFVLKA